MARKKKSIAAATPVPVVEAPPEAPVLPPEPKIVRRVLSRSEIDGLARWAAEAKYADIYTELKERDRRTLLTRIDPKGELAPIDTALSNAKAAKARAAAMYMKLADVASQRLGVNVTEYAYDDETGLLSIDPVPKER